MSQCSIFRVGSRHYRLSREIKAIKKELKKQREMGTPERLLETGIKELARKKERLNQIKKEAKLLK